MSQLLVLLIVSFLIWLWLRGSQLKILANDLAKKACAESQVQFLDGTVVLKKIYLTKHNNKIHLARIYKFDFAVDGNLRKNGFVSFVGNKIEQIHLKYNPDEHNSG
ncbi:MAG: hypothetical protein DRQ51_06170 [Gammaproteobacteria bacterium]|nr:MAG: hypothetical protein DRQ51_06170 [Gammaproteobacteria bacterium]